MSVPGEIISLHFGPFANYVGTHVWNFQVCFQGDVVIRVVRAYEQ